MSKFLIHVDFNEARGELLLDRQDGRWNLVYKGTSGTWGGGNGNWTQGKIGFWQWDTSRDFCLLYDDRAGPGCSNARSEFIAIGLQSFNPKAATFGFVGTAVWGSDLGRGVQGAPRGSWEIVADPDQIAEVRNELAALQAEIEATYRQIALDVLGCFDPTPISDCASAAMCIRSGEYVGAALSLIAVVPYIGDLLGKSAKFAAMVDKVRKAYERLKRVMNILQILEQKAARAKKMAQEAAERLAVAKRKALEEAANAEERIRVAFRAIVKKNYSEIAKAAGWRLDDLASACAWCKHSVPPKIVVARSRNPIALRYEGKAGYRPKPTAISKMKSSKSGNHEGLFVFPTRKEIEDWARREGKNADEYAADVQKEIKALEADGWTFDQNLVLRDRAGNAVYSDIDYMGIYNIKEGKSAGAWGGRLIENDDPFFSDWINELFHGKRKVKQHGNQDRFTKELESAAQDVNKKPGRKPGADELTDPNAFLVIGPDGVPRSASWEQLKEIYKQYGIPNPYG